MEYFCRGRPQLGDADSTVYWFLQHNTDFWVAYRRGHEKLYEEEFGPVRTSTQAGTFFGAGERGTDKNHFVAFFETQPSKTYGGSIKVAYRLGSFDFDFGGGPRFPPVSPPAPPGPHTPPPPGGGRHPPLPGAG